MAVRAPELPQARPTGRSASVTFNGRDFPLLLEPSGWRMRSRSKSHPADFRTGTTRLDEAKRRAKEWLEKRERDPIVSRKGGGTLEALAATYTATPKRTQADVADDNISRLRSICRLALGRELAAVTCREVGPELWQAYQVAALQKAGHKFDLVTRRRENIGINSAVRAARCIFLPALLRVYSAAGLSVRPDAGQAVMLPEPYVPPAAANDAEMLAAWTALPAAERRLWLVVGLARFAGLRRDEIAGARVSWIERRGAAVYIALRDRPEEESWTKTGKPYLAQVINAELAEHLVALSDFEPGEKLIVPDPLPGAERDRWFERVPQRWLAAHGVRARQPLHRLRGLYADHIAQLTHDAVTARIAAVREAQKSLGHTSSATTEAHYLTPDALR